MDRTLTDLLLIWDNPTASLPNSAKKRLEAEESIYFQRKVWDSNYYQNKKIRKSTNHYQKKKKGMMGERKC